MRTSPVAFTADVALATPSDKKPCHVEIRSSVRGEGERRRTKILRKGPRTKKAGVSVGL